MSDKPIFPPLTGWESTRRTLHLYCRAVGAIPRAHAEAHPKWWHISLKVQSDGLVTEHMALPGGGTFWLKMDLVGHEVLLLTNEGLAREFDMTQGLSATAFGDQLVAAIADLGLTAKYARDKFQDDEPREYDQAVVPNYLTALVNADRIFKEHRATLSGEAGPVQLWPHNFDLAFEWFGTRVEKYDDKELPSQLNLGFYPGDDDSDPYFYSNPWPFEADELLDKSLPEGASWHTEGWQGTILPYAELAGASDAEARLKQYARRVFEISKPTLTI
ncbi:MAG: DUF5996 family protein [Candidatus Promineifilaceae bacterium]